jgi:hypothetical protein
MAETRVHKMLASKQDPDLGGNWKTAAQRRGRQPGRSSASTVGEGLEIGRHSERSEESPFM